MRYKYDDRRLNRFGKGKRFLWRRSVSFIQYYNFHSRENKYPFATARCGNDLRLGENLFRLFPVSFSFLIFEDLRLRSHSLNSSTVALILECNELAVIDVSRARLLGQLFIQLFPSSEASYITLAAVSLLDHR